MGDLMELKCSTIIEDSIQLIPFENTFAAEEAEAEEEEEEILDPDGAFAKMRRSLVGSPIVTKDGRYACPHCNKTFSQKYIVPRHIRTVHMDHYSKCNICGEMVKNMRQHEKHKHRSNQKVKCVICNSWLDTKKELRQHQEEIHGSICVPTSKPTEKICPVCGIFLNSKKSLWLGHFYYQHMVATSFYMCPLPDCNKTVSKLEDDHGLKLHLSSHHSLQVEAIYHCRLCPQKCLSKDDLSGHIEVEHRGVDQINCSHCDTAFPCHQLLALHLYQEHGLVLRSSNDRGVKVAKLTTENALCLSESDHQQQPTATKYTFVEPFHLKSDAEAVFDGGENAADVEEIFFEIDNGMIVENKALSRIDLPKGATLIKATEDEILVEVDESKSEETTRGGFLSTPNVELKPLPPMSKDSQNVVIYLGDSLVEPDLVDAIPKVKRRKTYPDEKKYPCRWKGCPKTFVAKHSVNIHMRNVHLSESVECNLCGKSYTNEENLKVHVRTVHDAVSTPCKWPGCSRVLSSERQMQSHFLKHSEEPKSCPHKGCSSILKNSSVLRMHIKKMHNNTNNKKTDVPPESLPPPTITTYKLK